MTYDELFRRPPISSRIGAVFRVRAPSDKGARCRSSSSEKKGDDQKGAGKRNRIHFALPILSSKLLS